MTKEQLYNKHYNKLIKLFNFADYLAAVEEAWKDSVNWNIDHYDYPVAMTIDGRIHWETDGSWEGLDLGWVINRRKSGLGRPDESAAWDAYKINVDYLATNQAQFELELLDDGEDIDNYAIPYEMCPAPEDF